MFELSEKLTGKIAIVGGASRGVGRGIALALGEAGATVYVTGRSTRTGTTTENLPGTIDETAEMVTQRGGNGIAHKCDHTNEREVTALIARVRAEQGRLDLLVNNIWGGYERYEADSFVAPFWEQPLRRWDDMFHAGVRAHLITSRIAAPLLIERKDGLLVSTTAWDDGKYLGNLVYDTAKMAIHRMIHGMARELAARGVTAVSLAPGFVRTERVLAAHAAHPIDLSETESPEYTGRAVVALASDPDRMRWTGRILAVGDLAQAYDFTDIDGRQVPRYRLPEELRIPWTDYSV